MGQILLTASPSFFQILRQKVNFPLAFSALFPRLRSRKVCFLLVLVKRLFFFYVAKLIAASIYPCVCVMFTQRLGNLG
uniref:Uncharacterized protein n=1 Tax=Rhizophora mucronata TaxID=61149 RepID=A0A2P2K6J0_RHIMU